MSPTVNGTPSDHLMPLRILKIAVRPSSRNSKLSARLCTMLSGKGRENPMRFSLSVLLVPAVWMMSPVSARRKTPPYCPMVSRGTTMSGFSGRRSDTGGSSPFFTFSESMGASPKVRLIRISGSICLGARVSWIAALDCAASPVFARCPGSGARQPQKSKGMRK